MSFAEQSNNRKMISNHALHGGCRHECFDRATTSTLHWISGNGSFNDDVEWGFRSNDDIVPTSQRGSSRLLSSHTQHTLPS